MTRGLLVPRILVVAATAAALSACSATDAAPQPPTSTTAIASIPTSPTRSSMPSPTATPPALPEAAKQPTREGAVEFVKYFWELYSYGFNTGDSAPLRAVSDLDCKFCMSSVASLDSLREREAVNEGGAVTVISAAAAPGEPNEGILVNTLISQQASRLIAANGQITDVSAGTSNDRSDAAIVWQDGGWRVLEVQIFDSGEHS